MLSYWWIAWVGCWSTMYEGILNVCASHWQNAFHTDPVGCLSSPHPPKSPIPASISPFLHLYMYNCAAGYDKIHSVIVNCQCDMAKTCQKASIFLLYLFIAKLTVECLCAYYAYFNKIRNYFSWLLLIWPAYTLNRETFEMPWKCSISNDYVSNLCAHINYWGLSNIFSNRADYPVKLNLL